MPISDNQEINKVVHIVWFDSLFMLLAHHSSPRFAIGKKDSLRSSKAAP